MYAIQLRLMDRHCIVLGGGRVAQRKVRPLLAEGALVEVIAPALCGELQQLAAAGKIRWRAAGYTAGCLAGAFLVFCATDDLAVNAAAAAEAQRQGSLVNVAAPPEHSDFQVPASIRRGRLQLTVSTGGASPAFSRLLRERLEREYGRVYGEWLECLERLRAELRDRPRAAHRPAASCRAPGPGSRAGGSGSRRCRRPCRHRPCVLRAGG